MTLTVRHTTTPILTLHDQHVVTYVWCLYLQQPTRSLRHQLVQLYQPWLIKFCHHVYRKFTYQTDFEDYIQLGNIGLLQAIDHFDPKFQQTYFLAYARKHVQGSILKGLANFSPSGLVSIEQLQIDEGLDELALWIIETSLQLFADQEGHYSAWLDHNPHTLYEQQQQQQQLRHLIKQLPVREYQLLYHHYYLGQTFEHIGQQLDLTRARISQLHRQALEHLRQLAQNTS